MSSGETGISREAAEAGALFLGRMYRQSGLSVDELAAAIKCPVPPLSVEEAREVATREYLHPTGTNEFRS